MTLTAEEIQQITYDLQYGTSEEAEAAVKKAIGLQEAGKIPPGSGIEKLIENESMRQKIADTRETDVMREIAGHDPGGHFEREPYRDAEGVLIEYGASHRQKTLRPAVKAFPNVMNNNHGMQAVSERVDFLVEEHGYDYDDEATYLEAAGWVNEIETKADRLDEDHERTQAMNQYIADRGKQFKEE